MQFFYIKTQNFSLRSLTTKANYFIVRLLVRGTHETITYPAV